MRGLPDGNRYRHNEAATRTCVRETSRGSPMSKVHDTIHRRALAEVARKNSLPPIETSSEDIAVPVSALEFIEQIDSSISESEDREFQFSERRAIKLEGCGDDD